MAYWLNIRVNPSSSHSAISHSAVSTLTGKHGLIVGVANKRSISWAIAQAASAASARLALTYPSARLEENVRDLAAQLDQPVIAPCDVASDRQIADLAVTLDREFGGLDFFVHGAAFAPAPELQQSVRRHVARGVSRRARRERVLRLSA